MSLTPEQERSLSAHGQRVQLLNLMSKVLQEAILTAMQTWLEDSYKGLVGGRRDLLISSQKLLVSSLQRSPIQISAELSPGPDGLKITTMLSDDQQTHQIVSSYTLLFLLSLLPSDVE